MKDSPRGGRSTYEYAVVCHHRGCEALFVAQLFRSGRAVVAARGLLPWLREYCRRMGGPNVLVHIALLGFLLLTAACFSLLEPRRAVLYLLLVGWLFLPQFDGRFRVLILTSKAAFVPAVVLLGSITFDARWRRFRPRLFDLPMAVLCVGPFVSALSNELGAKEAVSAMLDATMTWG